MPNTFKYHIRKLFTKKTKETHIYQHTTFTTFSATPLLLQKHWVNQTA